MNGLAIVRRRAVLTGALALGGVVLLSGCTKRQVDAIRSRDLREAAAALDQNIEAIQRKDVDAYLEQYLDSPNLVIVSADSLRRGYLPFAEARRASDEWPDTLIVGPPALIWVAPGVVWGGFEYEGVVGRDTARGWSERLFVKTGRGWRIAVTGMMERQ